MDRNRQRRIKRYSTMYIFMLPAIIVSLIFYYRPMVGLIMAFQDYDIVKGMFGSPFVGFENFQEFIKDKDFWIALRNTLAINGLYILIGFPLPIALAIMIFGMRDSLFKKITQTISYLPHFVSWVVIAGVIYKLLDIDGGIVNILLKNLGAEPIAFMREPDYFWGIITIVNIWKEIGWSTIIYLAALASIDASQYEAAMVDGANGYDQLVHITLPSLAPIIGLMLIFTMGTLVSSNSTISFDAIYNMRNALIASRADTLDYYIYSTGVQGVKYGLATAAGFMLSLISLFLVLGSNSISRRIRGYGAF